jgi:hypothetical protein
MSQPNMKQEFQKERRSIKKRLKAISREQGRILNDTARQFRGMMREVVKLQRRDQILAGRLS